MTFEDLERKILAMSPVKKQEQAGAISSEMTYERLAEIISEMSFLERQENVAVWWEEVDLSPGV